MNDNPCDACREQLVDFADGELTAADMRHVAEHLDACPACRAELRLLEQSLRLAQQVWDAAAPAGEVEVGPVPPSRTARAAPSAARRDGSPVRRAIGVGVAASLVFLVALIGLRAPAPDPAEPVDIQRLISLEARAARLRMSAELLASQPGLEQVAAEAEAYLSELSARRAGQP